MTNQTSTILTRTTQKPRRSAAATVPVPVPISAAAGYFLRCKYRQYRVTNDVNNAPADCDGDAYNYYIDGSVDDGSVSIP